MKLIIAYLPKTAFEPVRTDLLKLGVNAMTTSEVHSSAPRSAVTLQYRRASMVTHLRSQMRVECFATDDQAPAVVGVLRRQALRAESSAGRVAVLELEELHHTFETDGLSDDSRLSSTAVY